MKKSAFVTIVVVATAVAALAGAPAGLAKDGDVLVQGSCSKGSSAKLKLSEENGRMEVDFEVDQNRNGVVWNVQLTQNGSTVFSGNARTKAPSGSFEVRRLLINRAGADTIGARAVNPSTGEVCTASATF